MGKSSKTAKLALTFIVLMGVVSMFSDMTHESARGIMGAYLSLAGASAAAIGFVSGLGEMLGYSLRLLSGVLADRTKKYWLFSTPTFRAISLTFSSVSVSNFAAARIRTAFR